MLVHVQAHVCMQAFVRACACACNGESTGHLGCHSLDGHTFYILFIYWDRASYWSETE